MLPVGKQVKGRESHLVATLDKAFFIGTRRFFC